MECATRGDGYNWCVNERFRKLISQGTSRINNRGALKLWNLQKNLPLQVTRDQYDINLSYKKVISFYFILKYLYRL